MPPRSGGAEPTPLRTAADEGIVRARTAFGRSMETQRYRTATLPSALVLRRLCADHAGDPPRDALDEAGFDPGQVAGYFERCTAGSANVTAPASAA
jgi:hypothetical protein